MKEINLLRDVAQWAKLFLAECEKAECEIKFTDKAEKVHWENLNGRLYWAIKEWEHHVQQKPTRRKAKRGEK